MAMALVLAVVGGAQAVDDASVLPGLDVTETVDRLTAQHGFDCDSKEFEEGFRIELRNMVGRRLELVNEDAEGAVRSAHPVVPLRMILEWKKDGRKKGRLILQGFREPPEWDHGSNASPVAFNSTIRTLLFGKGGGPDDVISSIDVSVAFLQSDDYGPDDLVRYVSYRPYKGARDYRWRDVGTRRIWQMC